MFEVARSFMIPRSLEVSEVTRSAEVREVCPLANRPPPSWGSEAKLLLKIQLLFYSTRQENQKNGNSQKRSFLNETKSFTFLIIINVRKVAQL